jgi:hypothetical protein
MTTLMGFLEGAFPRLTEEQKEMYGAMLMMEDAEKASMAILTGVNDWKFPPSWAEIKERIRSLERRPGDSPREQQEIQEERFDRVLLPWVKQWTYARTVAKDMRPFRESYPRDYMDGNEPAAGWMPTNLYAKEAELITDKQAMAAVAGGVDILDLLGPT